MAVPTPEFTDSFLVQDLNNNYDVFIGIVRKNVIRYCSDRRPGIVQPVLPPEQKVPRYWFHVLLRTNTSSLTLAIRMDNLYLVGFKTQAGVWWEFNNEDKKHLIRDAQWLGFGGRYQDLIGQKALETVSLGRGQMAAAVNALANYGTKILEEQLQQGILALEEEELLQAGRADPTAVAKSMLAKLLIMICEGLRFITVSGTVGKEFENPAATITQQQGKQVTNWDRISAAVFEWAKDPNAKFPELEPLGVKNKDDAAKVVALVKDQN